MTRAAALGLALLACSAAAQQTATVDQERLLATIRSLPLKRAALSDAEHLKGLRETEALLQKNLTDLGYTPVVQEFTWTYPLRKIRQDPAEQPVDQKTGQGADTPQPDPKPAQEPPPDPAIAQHRNIIADLKGTQLSREVILVSAHFDAVPHAPGADDDGTGVAAVLEMARVLKDQPAKRTIRFALFTLEEAGLVGAQHYVTEFVKASKLPDAPDAPKEKIVGMMSLEMLGFFTDAPNSQKSPIPKIEGVFDPPTVGDSIVVVGIAKHQKFSHALFSQMREGAPDLKVTLIDFLPVPIPDMTRSDHRPFLLADIPAVMVTDTANFRNPNYHQPTDTIDTLDPKRFTLTVKALTAAVRALADAP